MKANAPEKIFLEWYRIGDEKYRDWCIVPKTNDEPVEYTRTDAFVEKAVEYIKEHLFDYWSQSVTDESRFIDAFRKYMKGE